MEIFKTLLACIGGLTLIFGAVLVFAIIQENRN